LARLVVGGGAKVDSVGDLPQERIQLLSLLWLECCEQLLLAVSDRAFGA
jgi:hypothetical protein